MIRTMTNNWWLLVLCGLLDAIFAFIVLVQDVDGSLTLRTYALKSTVMLLDRLALAAGICTIAAGIWKSAKGKCWLLVVNGLALIALGLFLSGIFGPQVAYRTIAGLIIVMAISISILESATARTLRHHLRDQWFLGLAAAASVGFALVFLSLKSHPGAHSDFILIGSYFGFSAICMIGLPLLLHRNLTALGNPNHAH